MLRNAKLAGSSRFTPGARQTITFSAMSWKPERKCAELFSPMTARERKIDAEMGEGLLVDRLLADRRDQHLDAVLGEERRRSHRRDGGAQHRRGAAEASVAQRGDAPGSGKRLLAGPLPAPAEGGEASAEARRMRGRGRARVVHDADHRPFGALAQEFGDKAGGVRGRAGAGIVLRVGEHDRSRRGSCDAKGLAHGVIDRQRAMRGEARLGRDERREETIGGGVDRSADPGRRP